MLVGTPSTASTVVHAIRTSPPTGFTRLSFACRVRLAAMAIWLMAGIAAAQGSLSSVASEADVRLTLDFELDGALMAAEGAGPTVMPGQRLTLIASLSWKGADDLIVNATLAPLKLTNSKVEAGATVGERRMADATLKQENGRMNLRWRVPVEREQDGAAQVGRLEANVVFKGFEDRPAYPVDPPNSASWTWGGKPFPIVQVLLWVFGIGVGGSVLYLAGRWVVSQAGKASTREESQLPEHNEEGLSATPFEQAHSELASCDMKAQVGDIEGYFAKLRPILYSFVAATEGPGVRNLSSEDLARHLASVDYNPRVAALLIEALEYCERYDATRQDPPEETCVALVRELRLAALHCMKRPPRGAKIK